MSGTPIVKALDRLKKAANLVPAKKTVILSDGSEFEFYCSPLTMAERERAQKNAGNEDASVFALQLMITKAQDESGQPLFKAAEIAELKNEVRDEDLQKIMLAVIVYDKETEPKN